MFLTRQVYLDASISAVIQLKNEAELSFSHMFNDIDGHNVLHNYAYQIDKRSEFEHRYLRNFITMNLLAQSVENFESFLKLTINNLPQTGSGTKFKTFLGVPLFWLSPRKEILRTNKDRIKYIKSNCNELGNCLSLPSFQSIYKTFLLAENVRHLTIHSKMIVHGDKMKLVTKSKEFEAYFKIEIADKKEVLFTDVEKAQQITFQISTLAYIIFEALSRKYKLPISIALI